MNIFNKIVVVLILIFLVCFSIVSVVNVFAAYFKWSDLALRILNPEYTMNKFAATLALLAILVISLFLILMEFYRKRAKVANISSSKTGSAMVTLETISGQIKNEVLKVEGLEDLKVKILPGAAGIIINMDARLNENVDIPGKMQEIIDRASNIVSDKLGIKVIKTNLTITGLVVGVKEAESKEEKSKSKEAEQELEECGTTEKVSDEKQDKK